MSLTGSETPLHEVFKFVAGDAIGALAWSPTGDRLAFGSLSGELFVVEVATQKTTLSIPEAHFMGTQALAWSPDGSKIASGGCDGKVKVWDLTSGVVFGEYLFKGSWVNQLLWGEFEKGTQKKGFIIAVAGKKMACLQEDGSLVHLYPDHPFGIEDLTWRPKSAQFSASSHGGVSVWSVMKPKLERTYEWKNPALFHRWSPDGQWIAAGGQDGSVHMWIAKSGVDFHMGGYMRKVERLAWHPAGRYLATPNGGNIAIWDCAPPGPEGRVPDEYAWHEKNVVSLCYQFKGDLLASGGEEGNVAFWLPQKRDFPVGKLALQSSVLQLAWRPDDQAIAVGLQSGEVRIFDRE
jgi:WD40 repeat protein